MEQRFPLQESVMSAYLVWLTATFELSRTANNALLYKTFDTVEALILSAVQPKKLSHLHDNGKLCNPLMALFVDFAGFSCLLVFSSF